MVKRRIDELPLYPEERNCKKPTTEQVFRLFSLTQRHILVRHEKPVQVFHPQMTELHKQVLDLLGVPERAFRISR